MFKKIILYQYFIKNKKKRHFKFTSIFSILLKKTHVEKCLVGFQSGARVFSECDFRGGLCKIPAHYLRLMRLETFDSEGSG